MILCHGVTDIYIEATPNRGGIQLLPQLDRSFGKSTANLIFAMKLQQMPGSRRACTDHAHYTISKRNLAVLISSPRFAIKVLVCSFIGYPRIAALIIVAQGATRWFGSIEILRQSRMPQKICEQGAGALCRRRLVLLGRVRASVREMISDIDAKQ